MKQRKIESVKAEITRRKSKISLMKKLWHKFNSRMNELKGQKPKQRNQSALNIYRAWRDNCENSIDANMNSLSKLKKQYGI